MALFNRISFLHEKKRKREKKAPEKEPSKILETLCLMALWGEGGSTPEARQVKEEHLTRG